MGKYAPSKLRYMAGHPQITFTATIELKNRIEGLAKIKGMSKSQLVKRFFEDMVSAFDDLKEKHKAEMEINVRESYQKGVIDTEIQLRRELILSKQKNAHAEAELIKLKRSSEECKNARSTALDEISKLKQKQQRELEEAMKKYRIDITCAVCKKPIYIEPDSALHSIIKDQLIIFKHDTC